MIAQRGGGCCAYQIEDIMEFFYKLLLGFSKSCQIQTHHQEIGTYVKYQSWT